MAGRNLAIVKQIEQWFKRLLEQLSDLEECRSEINGDELELMKEQTVQQIKKFAQMMERAQKSDPALEPEFSQLKVNLSNLVNRSFHTDELVKYFGTRGITDLGLQLLQLQEDFKLKKVDSIIYFEQKRRILKELKSRGCRLSEKEATFLAQV